MPLTAIELHQSDWLQKRAVFLSDWFKLVAEKNMPLNYSSKWSKELNFSEFMTMFEYLLADLVALKLNQSLRNDDLDLTQLAQCYDLESLFQIYSDLQQKKLMVEQNVQTQLVLDQLFIQLMHVV
jgi:DNA polymerase-3 subunit delta'